MTHGPLVHSGTILVVRGFGLKLEIEGQAFLGLVLTHAHDLRGVDWSMGRDMPP